MNAAPHPLVLGAATGYKPGQISLFVDSLKNTGYKGAVAIIIDRSNVELQEYLASEGIESVLIDTPPKWMPKWLADRRFNNGRMHVLHDIVGALGPWIPGPLKVAYAVHVVAAFHHIVNGRFFVYLDFLQKNAHRFSHVLLADIRDVVFQSDPFEGVPEKCLWVFQESGDYTLGNEPNNYWWLQVVFGPKIRESIQDNGILCAATTLGSMDLMLPYLRRMMVELIKLTPKQAIRGSFGFDQAIHNWLFWTGALPGAEVKKNFAGTVATLQLEPPERFHYDDQGRLLNLDGRPSPVLHQYDRHPEIVQRVTAQQQAVR
jgi:hypothetical protein